MQLVRPTLAMSCHDAWRWPDWLLLGGLCYLLVSITVQETIKCWQLGSACRNVTCPTRQSCLLIGYRIERRRDVIDVFLGDEKFACVCSCSLTGYASASQTAEPLCQLSADGTANLTLTLVNNTNLDLIPVAAAAADDDDPDLSGSGSVRERFTPAHFQSSTLTRSSLSLLRQALRKLTTKKSESATRSEAVTPKTGSEPSYSRLLQEELMEKNLLAGKRKGIRQTGFIVYDRSPLSGSTIAMFVIVLVIIMIAIILSFYSK